MIPFIYKFSIFLAYWGSCNIFLNQLKRRAEFSDFPFCHVTRRSGQKEAPSVLGRSSTNFFSIKPTILSDNQIFKPLLLKLLSTYHPQWRLNFCCNWAPEPCNDFSTFPKQQFLHQQRLLVSFYRDHSFILQYYWHIIRNEH